MTYYVIDTARMKLVEQRTPGTWCPLGRDDVQLLEHLADTVSSLMLFETDGTDPWFTSSPDIVKVDDISGYLSNRQWTSSGRDHRISYLRTMARRAKTPLQQLEAAKARAVDRVDAKTSALIAAGFVVDGKTFSASSTAQMKWLGMFASRDALSYPIIVPTMDDKSFVALVDAADVTTYYTALLTTVQARLTAGITLKAQIAQATILSDLAAIVDNRT